MSEHDKTNDLSARPDSSESRWATSDELIALFEDLPVRQTYYPMPTHVAEALRLEYRRLGKGGYQVMGQDLDRDPAMIRRAVEGARSLLDSILQNRIRRGDALGEEGLLELLIRVKTGSKGWGRQRVRRYYGCDKRLRSILFHERPFQSELLHPLDRPGLQHLDGYILTVGRTDGGDPCLRASTRDGEDYSDDAPSAVTDDPSDAFRNWRVIMPGEETPDE